MISTTIVGDMNWMEEFKKMEENESEDIAYAFVCCVCRDLLYKPVILVCGHVSCFWCVHFSMDGLNKSSCPVCRNQYVHFPFVCQMLHLLLQKLYPEAYARRESQTLEDEIRRERFSPEIQGPACLSQHDAAISLPDSTSHAPEVIRTIQMHKGEIASEVKLMASCGSCKEMLVQPVALNCGHVFCIACIVRSTEGFIKCEVCQTPHPGATPKVCLELDHFLEEQFPQEYSLRREILSKKGHPINKTHTACSSKANENDKDILCLLRNNPDLHVGVGCDYCGMYPIIGDRYKCINCVELIGFDLCKDCYTSNSKLPGRFNQQHTSDHKFKIVKTDLRRKQLLLRWSVQFLGSLNPSSDTAADGNTDGTAAPPSPENNPDSSG